MPSMMLIAGDRGQVTNAQEKLFVNDAVGAFHPYVCTIMFNMDCKLSHDKHNVLFFLRRCVFVVLTLGLTG